MTDFADLARRLRAVPWLNGMQLIMEDGSGGVIPQVICHEAAEAIDRLNRELAEARVEHAAEVDDLCMTNNCNVEAGLRAQRELAEARAALVAADKMDGKLGTFVEWTQDYAGVIHRAQEAQGE